MRPCPFALKFTVEQAVLCRLWAKTVQVSSRSGKLWGIELHCNNCLGSLRDGSCLIICVPLAVLGYGL